MAAEHKRNRVPLSHEVSMRYELLGPLRVANSQEYFTLSAPKMEALLTLLLTSAGQSVTKGQLISELWGPGPPRRAAAAIHVYISQLRKFLVSAGDTEGKAIATTSAGYRLHRGTAGLDVDDFQEAMRVGRRHQHGGCHEKALPEFERALALVRGPVLAGIAQGTALGSFAAWVEEERLACLELLVDTRTALGRHREVINLLSSLTAQYPLHESFYRQLMLVLYRSERQAEALEVYRSARQVLRTELGLEPCRSLRRMHQAILTSDQHLDVPLAG